MSESQNNLTPENNITLGSIEDPAERYADKGENETHTSTSNEKPYERSLLLGVLQAKPEHPLIGALKDLHHRCRPEWFNYKEELEKLVRIHGDFDWNFWIGRNPQDVDHLYGVSLQEFEQVSSLAKEKLRRMARKVSWAEMQPDLLEWLERTHKDVMEGVRKEFGRDPAPSDLVQIIWELPLNGADSGRAKPDPLPVTHTVQRANEAPQFAETPGLSLLTEGFEGDLPVAAEEDEVDLWCAF